MFALQNHLHPSTSSKAQRSFQRRRLLCLSTFCHIAFGHPISFHLSSPIRCICVNNGHCRLTRLESSLELRVHSSFNCQLGLTSRLRHELLLAEPAWELEPCKDHRRSRQVIPYIHCTGVRSSAAQPTLSYFEAQA